MEISKKSTNVLDNLKNIDAIKNDRQLFTMAENIRIAKMKMEALTKSVKEKEKAFEINELNNACANKEVENNAKNMQDDKIDKHRNEEDAKIESKIEPEIIIKTNNPESLSVNKDNKNLTDNIVNENMNNKNYHKNLDDKKASNDTRQTSNDQRQGQYNKQNIADNRQNQGNYKTYNDNNQNQGNYKPYNNENRQNQGNYKPYNNYNNQNQGNYKPYNNNNNQNQGANTQNPYQSNQNQGTSSLNANQTNQNQGNFKQYPNNRQGQNNFKSNSGDFRPRQDFKQNSGDFKPNQDYRPRNTDFKQGNTGDFKSNTVNKSENTERRVFSKQDSFVRGGDFKKPTSGFNNYNNNNRPFNPNFKPNFANNRPFNSDNKGTFTKPPFNKFNNDKNKTSAVKFMDNIVLENTRNKYTNTTNKKKNDTKQKNENKGIKIILKNGQTSAEDDERIINRRIRTRKGKIQENTICAKVENAIITTNEVSIKTLSEKIGESVANIIKKLMIIGIMANINTNIDFATAELVAGEFKISLTQKLDKTADEQLLDQVKMENEEGNIETRPPVVTIMGHVDHGKTSLLDKIRKTSVATGEAGGITQHIGAYSINFNGNKITFIDTPGHEAFTSMRARGASVTDVAILVVAADDGVMPQTIEAIKHIQKAKVPMIVAINKIDKPDANIPRIKQQLSENGVLPEEWGGEAVLVPVSAQTGEGLDNLLQAILVVTEVSDLRCNSNRSAIGTILEAQLDKGKGPIATVLVQNGTLKIGDTIVSGLSVGRVRAMMDDKGKNIKEATPSTAVSILGLDQVPSAGDTLIVVDEKVAKQVIDDRKDKLQLAKQNVASSISAEDFLKSMDNKRSYNIIIKADMQGSFEALKQMFQAVENEEVCVKCVHGGVGAITETDVELAKASNARIIAFNVKADANANIVAEREKIDIGYYKIIYTALEDVQIAIKAMLTPIFEKKIVGHCEVRVLFKISRIGTVAGCYVLDGKIPKNAHIKIMRNKEEIIDTTIVTLQKDKQDVKEVTYGHEVGIKLDGFNDIKELDIFEAYIMEQIKR